jgi:tetratricopeptide (TPR) repeat protein
MDGGNTDIALAEVRKLDQECPNNETVLTTLGRAQVETQQYEEAVITLSRKEIHNDNVEAQYNLGLAYAEMPVNSCDEALNVFEKLQDIPKVKLRVSYNIGRCFYKLRRLEEAIKLLEYVVSRKQQSQKFFSFALYYLKEANAQLWYKHHQNKNSLEESTFRTQFLHYYEMDFENREINDQRSRLQQINERILNINLLKDQPKYSFIYSTPEFRQLVCKLHQKSKTQSLSKICNSGVSAL